MGQSAAELRRDIDYTRGELSEDLEAIGDRVSPRRMLERRTNRMRDFFSNGRERIFGRAGDARDATMHGAHHTAEAVREAPERAVEQVEGHPVVAGAIAFGVGFLAAVVFPGSEAEARAAERLASQAQPLTEGITEGAKEAAREVAASAQEAGRESADRLKESATEKVEQVKETVTDEKETLQQQGR
jgi:ElaB/YqjD/DUF883 family membrane-anchored ribosome-binding protein